MLGRDKWYCNILCTHKSYEAQYSSINHIDALPLVGVACSNNMISTSCSVHLMHRKHGLYSRQNVRIVLTIPLVNSIKAKGAMNGLKSRNDSYIHCLRALEQKMSLCYIPVLLTTNKASLLGPEKLLISFWDILQHNLCN